MNPPRATKSVAIPESLIRYVGERLAANKRVRRTLPGSGRVHIDRQLPFLCVHRIPRNSADDGTKRLVMGEASYLIASGHRGQRSSLGSLVREIVQTLSAQFGAFLVVELWAGSEDEASEAEDAQAERPAFRILARGRVPSRTVDALHRALLGISVGGMDAEVGVEVGAKPAPRGMSPLLSVQDARALGGHLIGVEVRPIHRDVQTGKAYPLVRRELVHELTHAFLQTFYQFARTETKHRPPHFHSLGRRAVVKAVWEVDRVLAEVSDEFDLLLQLSPVNPRSAWSEFQRHRFERAPTFMYRRRGFDPETLKRRLWNIHIERLEDPTLGNLFREKRSELDVQLSMLADLDTPQLLMGSLRAYGKPDRELVERARSVLEQLPPRSRERGGSGTIGAKGFAELAREEISHYRERYPELTAKVFVRSDTTGLMVSRGNLLVGSETTIPRSRVDALLQHELGTHMVTYFNGRAQPFRQLSLGLAGYDALQEGIAVLAEYLVGGLSRPRLRLLAGRVLAVDSLVDGAGFVETFRTLHGKWEFTQRTAFVTTMRVYRGGGLTKDAMYLKGLAELLAYLRNGGQLEPLFVGKVALDHMPLVRELQLRGVLKSAPLRPRYMERPETKDRLKGLRQGLTIIDLTKGI